MGTQKNAIYKVHNGTDFDTIHFETGENNLVNITQQLSINGYRKLPGGFIKIWGYTTVNLINGEFNSIFSFHTAFPNECFGVRTTINSINSDFNSTIYFTCNSRIASGNDNKILAVTLGKNTDSTWPSTGNATIYYEAIGY